MTPGDHGRYNVAMHTINAEWHRRHKMPKHTTIAQRVVWHRAHASACGCREIPAGVRALVVTKRSRRVAK